MKRDTQIYVALRNEGVDVWRPVRAECVGENVYRIVDQPYDRSIESWQFEPGDEVYCETIEAGAGRILAATRKAEGASRQTDAIVRVKLRATSEGGRKSAIPPIVYRCPVFFGSERKEANDCAFFLDEIDDTLEPGGTPVVVSVKFFAPEFVVGKLLPGARFTLWEGRDIGEAEVLEVVSAK